MPLQGIPSLFGGRRGVTASAGSVPAGALVDIDPFQEAYANNDAITTLTDWTGHGWTATATGGTATFKTNIINGLPVARYAAASIASYIFAGALGAQFSGSGTAVVLVKINTDPPAASSSSGLWKVGDSPDSTHYPFTTGDIYEEALSTVRRGPITKAISLSSAFRSYVVTSTTSAHNIYLNNTNINSDGTNTFAFPAVGGFGRSTDPSVFLDGDIARLLLYARVWDATDRTNWSNYTVSHYGL